MQTNVYLPQLELTMESVTVTNVRVQEELKWPRAASD